MPETHTEPMLNDSRTPLRTGEPSFTLRGQDVLAPAIVNIWGDAQRFLEKQVREGFSVIDTVLIIESRLARVFEDISEEEPSPKVDGAYKVAESMERYSPKKVAD